MVDMSKFEITDATEMPRQTRTRTARANPFTNALKESDAERHDETATDGRTVSLGKPKQTGVLSTVKPDGGGPSELDTARNLVRRAGKDAEIGVITRVQVVDDNSAILVFQASDRRVLQPVPRDLRGTAPTSFTPQEAKPETPAKDAINPIKETVKPVIDAVKSATNTGSASDKATSNAAPSRDRAAARR